MNRREFLERQGDLFDPDLGLQIRQRENARRRQARAERKGAGIARAHVLAELGILEVEVLEGGQP